MIEVASVSEAAIAAVMSLPTRRIERLAKGPRSFAAKVALIRLQEDKWARISN